MTLQILESALKDLEDGSDFYDRQESGIGNYFEKCLFADIEKLTICGGIHRKVFAFYRSLSERFPYAIYYDVNSPGVVVIYRILDCRRNPE